MKLTMKKFFLSFIFTALALGAFAQEFVFPPELNWWLDEIKKVDSSVSIDKFKFVEESFICQDDHPVSYKNKLYPVFKKWNYFGDRFAYCNIGTELHKEKSGKYSLSGEPDSCFGVFDRNENLLFVQFFGSGGWLNSFCWVTDSRIVAAGVTILPTMLSNDNFLSVAFTIYDYQIKNSKMIVREYNYCVRNIKRIDWEQLKLNWYEQRSDYFENKNML